MGKININQIDYYEENHQSFKKRKKSKKKEQIDKSDSVKNKVKHN